MVSDFYQLWPTFHMLSLALVLDNFGSVSSDNFDIALGLSWSSVI